MVTRTFVAWIGLVVGCVRAQDSVVERPIDEAKLAVANAEIESWRPIFLGAEVCRGAAITPRPLQVRAVRIDLWEPTLQVVVTPSNGDKPLDCDARTTTQFLTEFRCQIAINGSAFDPLAKQPGDPQDVVGVSLSEGDLYSPMDDKGFAALLLDRDRKARIDSAPVDPAGAWNGLSGFYPLLVDGQNVGTMEDKHPRSAVGIDRDGRYLILMTIDGRQAGYSEGTTTAETAEWLRKLGAYQGINLDGGGSTTLVIEGDDGEPLIVNRPSGGKQRLVANHLGIRAKRLER